MQIEKIIPIIGKVPHMNPEQGSIVYNLILENNIDSILELGIAHGTGSCYMAAALDEKRKGSVITMDNKSAMDRKPNVHELSKKCGLTQYITPIFANTSYNWELMKLIDQQTKDGICQPIFDFCYVDGSHNFEIDCCAFFLVDKLLKPNGMILFDDLDWTYQSSPSLKNTDRVKAMTNDEKITPHIRKLVELIVIPHPNYDPESKFDNWFLVRKKGSAELIRSEKIELNQYLNEQTITQDIKSILKKVKRKLFS
ncbi:class I SAM-dependent methyltransferase [Aquimarina sp. SS2-1]|uniref:class I SAM-dependent methyltransferase n=1 Tax=Aquimarina besae TaxID=3342247 RepID=UPI00366FC564